MQISTIKEIVALMDLIEKEATTKVRKPKVSEQALDRGYQVSHGATAQPEQVAMTPYMKNALIAFGDIKVGEDGKAQRLQTNDPVTRAEKWFQDAQKRALEKFNSLGQSKKYNFGADLASNQFYDVDCWDNLKEGIGMRDIQPGETEEVEENIKIYGRPLTVPDVKGMLLKDKVFQKTVSMIIDMLPRVRASEEFRKINLPFMTKQSNVSYPYWQNDQNEVKGQGITYGELTMREAKALPIDRIYDYNVSTLYARFQRKGRQLIAISRIPNLILNQLEAEEIKAYKQRCPAFAGYNDDEYLRKVLNYFYEYCTANNLKCANWDQRRYDFHVSKGFILLLGAISIYCSNGNRSKNIALKRAALMTKTWLVDGITHQFKEIYGRIFSGFIDTNRGGGLINWIITTYCAMKQDPDYTKIAYDALWSMLVMGDDNLFMYRVLDHDKFVKDMADIGFEVNPDKQQFGVFFLQYRLFKDPTSKKIVMAYPWTRVLRSALFKERSKGLGPWGWTLATWQQLAKLVETPTYLKIVVNLLAAFDENKLGVDKTVSYVVKQVQKEDKEAATEKGEKLTTAQKLYDGDPTKARQFTDDGKNFDKGFLAKVHRAIKSVYDPTFLASLGLSVPKI